MQFDPNNKIVKLCAAGMEVEGQPEIALQLFQRAWNEASDDFEKFTAAHYVARHQASVADKLKWDEIALQLALNIPNESMKSHYPSLYLNVAKSYEDLKDLEQAESHYQLAERYAAFLPDDGYGGMIKAGIARGLARVQKIV